MERKYYYANMGKESECNFGNIIFLISLSLSLLSSRLIVLSAHEYHTFCWSVCWMTCQIVFSTRSQLPVSNLLLRVLEAVMANICYRQAR